MKLDELLVWNEISKRNDDDGEGCLVLITPFIIIGLILLFLNKMGIAPLEVWTGLKIAFFPASWDWQLDTDFSHLWTSLYMLGSIIALFLAYFLIGWGVQAFLNNSDHIKFPPFRLVRKLIDLAERGLMYLVIINLLIIFVRMLFHFGWGTLVWLVN
jgi:hypothetical protein